MRITSGRCGGRTIKPPKGIRPTQDRVREAYFSKMASLISGARFLDLYAGSGAVGIEAWSRGSSECVLVEQSRQVAEVAKANVRQLAEPIVRVVMGDVPGFLSQPATAPFELIYADPPYDLADDAGFGAELLTLVARGDWLAAGGVFTLERRAGRDPDDCEGWILLDTRKYGKSALDYYTLCAN